MHFLSTLALAAPLLCQVSGLVPFAGRSRHEGRIQSSKSTYDDSRIADYHDQDLVFYIRRYFDAFVGADFPVIESLQEPEYTMTDIPLGVIRAPRPVWNEINAGFTNLLTGLAVDALTVYGSSKPGDFSIMEHWVKFELAQHPPPGSEEHLPAGAKKGDVLGMINVSVIWWTEKGTMVRELEYGRITWKGFQDGQWGLGDALVGGMCKEEGVWKAGLKG